MKKLGYARLDDIVGAAEVDEDHERVSTDRGIDAQDFQRREAHRGSHKEMVVVWFMILLLSRYECGGGNGGSGKMAEYLWVEFGDV